MRKLTKAAFDYCLSCQKYLGRKHIVDQLNSIGVKHLSNDNTTTLAKLVVGCIERDDLDFDWSVDFARTQGMDSQYMWRDLEQIWIDEVSKERKFRAHYTHHFFVRSLKEIQEMAKNVFVKFEDPDNPTKKELAEVYKLSFEEMSDPWEVTANGSCYVEEIK